MSYTYQHLVFAFRKKCFGKHQCLQNGKQNIIILSISAEAAQGPRDLRLKRRPMATLDELAEALLADWPVQLAVAAAGENAMNDPKVQEAIEEAATDSRSVPGKETIRNTCSRSLIFTAKFRKFASKTSSS